jgi:hypothetical protein
VRCVGTAGQCTLCSTGCTACAAFVLGGSSASHAVQGTTGTEVRVYVLCVALLTGCAAARSGFGLWVAGAVSTEGGHLKQAMLEMRRWAECFQLTN